MTQAELSILARVSPARIYSIEAQQVKDIRLSTILRLAKALECKSGDLFPVLTRR